MGFFHQQGLFLPFTTGDSCTQEIFNGSKKKGVVISKKKTSSRKQNSLAIYTLVSFF